MSNTKPVVAVLHEQQSSGTDPHEHTGAETANTVVALLRERQVRPSVTIDAVDPEGHWVGFTAHDRSRAGLQYEFNVSGFVDAHKWIRQLAPKTWITKEHIEVFAVLVLESFTEDGRIASELLERFRS